MNLKLIHATVIGLGYDHRVAKIISCLDGKSQQVALEILSGIYEITDDGEKIIDLPIMICDHEKFNSVNPFCKPNYNHMTDQVQIVSSNGVVMRTHTVPNNIDVLTKMGVRIYPSLSTFEILEPDMYKQLLKEHDIIVEEEEVEEEMPKKKKASVTPEKGEPMIAP